MAQFLGDIAGVLELFAVAAGLVLFHVASKQAPAKFLEAAGYVLVIGGVAVGICTSWYWLQYQAAGDFDGAAPSRTWMRPGPHMMPGMHGY